MKKQPQNSFKSLDFVLLMARKIHQLPLMPEGPEKREIELHKPFFQEAVNKIWKRSKESLMTPMIDYLLFTANIDSYTPDERVKIGKKLLEEVDQSFAKLQEIIKKK